MIPMRSHLPRVSLDSRVRYRYVRCYDCRNASGQLEKETGWRISLAVVPGCFSAWMNCRRRSSLSPARPPLQKNAARVLCNEREADPVLRWLAMGPFDRLSSATSRGCSHPPSRGGMPRDSRWQIASRAIAKLEIVFELRHRETLPFIGLAEERAPLKRTEGCSLPVQRGYGAISAHVFHDYFPVNKHEPCSPLVSPGGDEGAAQRFSIR